MVNGPLPAIVSSAATVAPFAALSRAEPTASIGGASDDSNFNQMPNVPILRKFASNLPRNWTKGRRSGEPPFQALLLGWLQAAKRPRGIRGSIMRFLLRLGFWLTVILVCLPSGGSQTVSKVNVSAGEAISAATSAMSDLKEFCGRQSDACVVGSQVAAVLGQRAQAGAKMLYEFLNEHVGPSETGTVVDAASKSVPMPQAKPSQNTLVAPDRIPAWRGPQREAAAARSDRR
jgi:hypothetical protein